MRNLCTITYLSLLLDNIVEWTLDSVWNIEFGHISFSNTASFHFCFTLFVSCPVCWYVNWIQFSCSCFILFESQSQFWLSEVYCLLLILNGLICSCRIFLAMSFVIFLVESFDLQMTVPFLLLADLKWIKNSFSCEL